MKSRVQCLPKKGTYLGREAIWTSGNNRGISSRYLIESLKRAPKAPRLDLIERDLQGPRGSDPRDAKTILKNGEPIVGRNYLSQYLSLKKRYLTNLALKKIFFSRASGKLSLSLFLHKPPCRYSGHSIHSPFGSISAPKLDKLGGDDEMQQRRPHNVLISRRDLPV